MLFQRVGVATEKAHLLGPAKWNSSADGTQNIPLLLQRQDFTQIYKDSEEYWAH